MVCPDWPIFWSKQFSEQACVDELLQHRQKSTFLVEKFSNPRFHMDKVSQLDFSAQRFSGQELASVLNTLQYRTTKLITLILDQSTPNGSGREGASAIRDYLETLDDTVLSLLSLQGMNLDAPAMLIISQGFNSVQILSLSLNQNLLHNATIATLPTLLQVLSFDRAGLTAAGLKALMPALSEAKQLITLNLSHNDFRNAGAETFGNFSFPAALQRLDFTHNSLTATGLKALMLALRGAEQLKSLDLSSNNLNDAAAEILAALFLPTLQYFSFSSNHLTAVGLKALMPALSRAEQLRSLSLGDNDFGDAGAETFAASFPPFLKGLFFSYNKFTAKSLKALMPALNKAEHLHKLYLRNNNFADVVAETFGNFSFPPALQYLYFSGNQLTAAGFKALMPALNEAKQLNELFLFGNTFGNAGAEVFAASFPPALQTFDFNGNRLTAAGLKALMPAISKAKQLKSLVFYGNDFSGAGPETFVASFPPTLQNLNFNGGSLNAIGLKALMPALNKAKRLTSLVISQNDFGDLGAETFATSVSSSLQSLDFSDTHLAAAGLKALMPVLREAKKFNTLRLNSNDFGDEGVMILAKWLSPSCTDYYPLWIDWGDKWAAPNCARSALRYLSLQANQIHDKGAEALCKVLPNTAINDACFNNFNTNDCVENSGGLDLRKNLVSDAIAESCGLVSAASSSRKTNGLLSTIFIGGVVAAYLFHTAQSDVSLTAEEEVKSPIITSHKKLFYKEIDGLLTQVENLQQKLKEDLSTLHLETWRSKDDLKWRRWILEDQQRDLDDCQYELQRLKKQGSATDKKLETLAQTLDRIESYCSVSKKNFKHKMKWLQNKIDQLDELFDMLYDEHPDHEDFAINLESYQEQLDALSQRAKAMLSQLNQFRKKLLKLEESLTAALHGTRKPQPNFAGLRTGFFAVPPENIDKSTINVTPNTRLRLC